MRYHNHCDNNDPPSESQGAPVLVDAQQMTVASVGNTRRDALSGADCASHVRAC